MESSHTGDGDCCGTDSEIYHGKQYEEYNAHYNALVKRYEKAKAKAVSLQQQKEERLAKHDLIGGFMSELAQRKELLAEFDEKLWIALVEHVTVFQDGRLVFVFRDGTEIEA